MANKFVARKMVDFAFVLQPTAAEAKAIRNILTDEAPNLDTISQTFYSPLRISPVLLNIETKLPSTGGEQAGVQLAVWSTAGLARTRLLLDKRGREKVRIPTMPMLAMHGNDLSVSFLRERKDDEVENVRTANVPPSILENLLGFLLKLL